MDLPSTLGAPRHCYIGGNVYWVKPMTMEGLAIVMNWLDDVLSGRDKRKMPPKISDQASQSALASFPGKTMLTWLALREHGFSFMQAAEIVPHESDGEGEHVEKRKVEHFRLMEVFLARRRTRTPSEGGEDVSETWCEKGMAQLAAEYGISEIGKLTLDQYEWLSSTGEVDQFGQYDLQAIQDDLPRRIAMIEAAKKAGTLGVAQ